MIKKKKSAKQKAGKTKEYCPECSVFLHLQATSCEPSKASVGLLSLLTFGWARPVGGTSRGLEGGRKWGLRFLFWFPPDRALSEAVFLSKAMIPEGLVIDAVPPAPYSFRSQRRQRLPLLPPQIIRNLMIPGGIIMHDDFFYFCPMSINYSVIPLSLWSPFLRVPSVSASVWLLQVKEPVTKKKPSVQPALAGFKLLLVLPSCVTSGKSLTLLGLTLELCSEGQLNQILGSKNSILCMQLKL